MKPPSIKVPKCGLKISILYFVFSGHRSHVLTGLAMAPCEHCWVASYLTELLCEGAAYFGEPILNH